MAVPGPPLVITALLAEEVGAAAAGPGFALPAPVWGFAAAGLLGEPAVLVVEALAALPWLLDTDGAPA